jgi:Lrp/AsnC family transcriptional regulator, regulator for asnA, asnC and gidA
VIVEAFEARHAKDIDATDRALMRELQADGRLSCVELGHRVGLSEGAVRRRIKHLEAISALRIAGLPDPRVLGLNLQVLIGIEVTAGCLDSVRKSLVAMPELPYIYEGVDRFSFVASAFFADDAVFDSFCHTRLSAIAGIERFQVFRIRRAMKRAERWEAEVEEDGLVPTAVPPTRAAAHTGAWPPRAVGDWRK